MKSIKTVFGAFLIVMALACEGPQGPPGFDGLDGETTIATVFQESVTFDYDANANVWLSDILSFDGVLEGDVFLVYISLAPNLYTPLPASIFDEFGEFQYVFDHDINTVELQIIGDSDLSGLAVESTTNIPTRVVILPADLRAELSATDIMDFNKVLDMGGLDVSDIKQSVR